MIPGRVRGGPRELEAGEPLRRDRAEGEAGDDAEAACAGAAESPEQVLVTFFVARDNAAVGKYDLRLEKPVAGEAEAAADDAQSAPESEPGDSDRGAGAGHQGASLRDERVVDVAEQRSGSYVCDVTRAAHRRDRTQIEDKPARRRAARETVAAAANGERKALPSREGDRRGDVGGRPTARDRERTYLRILRPG